MTSLEETGKEELVYGNSMYSCVFTGFLVW